MHENHLYSGNWKLSQDKTKEYFGEILGLSSNQILTACKLLSAKKRNWTIAALLEADHREYYLEYESTHWWLEWEGLLENLEQNFKIQFPRKGDVEAGYILNGDGSYTKTIFEGINFEINSEQLSVLVSTLMSGEEIGEKFFIIASENITKEEMRKSMPFSDATKKLSYQILMEMPIESFMLGYCVLKNDDGREGRILIDDVVQYKAIVREMESKEITNTYNNIYEMIKDGWVVD